MEVNLETWCQRLLNLDFKVNAPGDLELLPKPTKRS